MEKKIWNNPEVETLSVEETNFTYLQGTVPDSGVYEENCDPVGPTYS